MAGARLGAYRTQEFSGGAYVAYRSDDRNVVAGVVSTLNPDKVLVGGRFARMGPLILSSIRQSIYGGSLPLATHAIDVEYLRNPSAEVTGTLVYAFERLLDSQCQAKSTRPVLAPLS